MKKIRTAFLWHFHQPCYFDHAADRARMPWVRLHATRDYLGLPLLLERYPQVRSTINVTPTLIAQLADVGRGVTDDFLDVSRVPAADLSAGERGFLLRNFFSLDREMVVAACPRYGQLLEKRGRDASAEVMKQRAATFTVAEMRDLQVLFNLSWFHPLLRVDEPLLKELSARGRNFTEEDRENLLKLQLATVGRVLPLWRKLADAGRIEFSVSPSYHPILPLLLDGPAPLPADARVHLERARASYEAFFGFPPAGCWPSEGAVSPETLSLLAETGFRWAASDEGILQRSLPPAERSERAHGRVYRHGKGDNALRLVFRDHHLSDRLGFVYRFWEPAAAADDFVARLREAGERVGDGADGLAIILDGENAWEHYPGGGLDFLSGLFHRLSEKPGIRTVTIGELSAAASGPVLGRVHAGSWIDSDFHIWAGHPAADAAWALLARVRGKAPLEEITPPAARESILAAEGSDWFWWYSPEHDSGRDNEFDRLFRTHLANFLRLRGEPLPAELEKPVAAADDETEPPRNPVRPVLDGRETSYFEWLGAGFLRVCLLSGAMHCASGTAWPFFFGWDQQQLYLRLDPEPDGPFFRRELEFRLDFGAAGQWRFASRNGKIEESGEARPFAVVADRIIEIAFPWRLLEAVPGRDVYFHLDIVSGEQRLGRAPARGALQLTVPDPAAALEFW